MPNALRIAMWSGPRNVSTALLRSFGSRADTVVCDEPFYAHWLRETGTPHPGSEQIQRVHETDWQRVSKQLTARLPAGKSVFYQKHMAHHLLPERERSWMAGMNHAFLIREPRAMLASLCEVVPQPSLLDTGLPQQVQLFEQLLAQGATPPVIDSADLLRQPGPMLRALCERLNLSYDPSMLTWETGPRDTDGCWSVHWYASVMASTGFEPYRPSRKPLPRSLAPLADACEPLYQSLFNHRLVPE